MLLVTMDWFRSQQAALLKERAGPCLSNKLVQVLQQ